MLSTENNRAVLGLDLGATKLSGALFRPDGRMCGYSSVSLEKRTGNDVGLMIGNFVKELAGKAFIEKLELEAIGCCVPGIVYHDAGKVWAPNIPGWENFPLKETIRNAMENKEVIVILDNDRACSIMGEVWQGSAKGCRNAIFLAVGTGIGAGIISNGQIIRGQSDIAGAIGWLALNPPFKDKYIPVGCFEYHASGDGLAKVAIEYLNDNPEYTGILNNTGTELLSARHVFNAFDQGDLLAEKVIRQAVTYWGMAVANLASLFNPEMIIFGGGVFGPALVLLGDIMEEARKWAQPISINQVSLVSSALGTNAGLYGSAFMALTGDNKTH